MRKSGEPELEYVILVVYFFGVLIESQESPTSLLEDDGSCVFAFCSCFICQGVPKTSFAVASSAFAARNARSTPLLAQFLTCKLRQEGCASVPSSVPKPCCQL